MITQKLKKIVDNEFSLAEKYYSILSDVNTLHLTEREIQLVAFTAVKGNISNGNVREEFCTKYKTSSPTINNIISKLKKMGIFVKDGGKVKVNPIIVLDFTKEITIEIRFSHGE